MGYLLVGILIIYCLIFVYKTKTGSPSVWSRDEHIRNAVKYVKPKMRVADLGCGDGRVLIAAVRAGAAQAEGWEIEPAVWLAAKRNIVLANLKNKVKIHFGDMWRADLSQVDLVYVYQLTRYAPRFVDKCRRELKRGAWVVANTYPLAGLPLVKQDGELFIYRM